jgi:hypothetical protein
MDLGLPGSVTVQPDIDFNDDCEVSSGLVLNASVNANAQFKLSAHLSAFTSVGANVNPNRNVSHSNLFLCSSFNIKELFSTFVNAFMQTALSASPSSSASVPTASTSSSAADQGASKRQVGLMHGQSQEPAGLEGGVLTLGVCNHDIGMGIGFALSLAHCRWYGDCFRMTLRS